MTVTTVLAALLTRRTAKEGNAVTGFKELTDSQGKAIARLEQRQSEDAARIERLEQRDRRRTQLAQAHTAWDYRIMREVESLKGSPVPDPPPLDLPIAD